MPVAFPSSPPAKALSRCCLGRLIRFASKLIFVAGLFVGGTFTGARWGDQCPLLAKRTPSTPPPTSTPQQPEQMPTGPELLANLDRRLAELRDELASAERAEREAEIACNLLRQQGMKTDAPAYREQAQMRAQATARKTELTAEFNDATRLRTELLTAMSDEQTKPGATDSDLTTRIRAFVIRQELLREPPIKPVLPSAPK